MFPCTLGYLSKKQEGKGAGKRGIFEAKKHSVESFEQDANGYTHLC
jgi:hypothetical protein